jgi:hypothetical protein
MQFVNGKLGPVKRMSKRVTYRKKRNVTYETKGNL